MMSQVTMAVLAVTTVEMDVQAPVQKVVRAVAAAVAPEVVIVVVKAAVATVVRQTAIINVLVGRNNVFVGVANFDCRKS